MNVDNKFKINKVFKPKMIIQSVVECEPERLFNNMKRLATSTPDQLIKSMKRLGTSTPDNNRLKKSMKRLATSTPDLLKSDIKRNLDDVVECVKNGKVENKNKFKYVKR